MATPYLIKDINESGNFGSGPLWMGTLNGFVYFGANNGINGFELWKSNGTLAGTTLVKDIVPGDQDGLYYDPGLADAFGGYLYFQAIQGASLKLWKTDGSSAGTLAFVANSSSAGYQAHIISTTRFGDTGRLWIGDGTTTGSQVLVLDQLQAYAFTKMGDFGYFEGNDGLSGRELWKTDGTAIGTVKVKEINPIPYAPSNYFGPPATGHAYPSELTVSNSQLFFWADDGTNGRELWTSDGTNSGTRMVKDINTNGGSNPRFLTSFNGLIYFEARDSINVRIWRSDGTESGTYLIKDNGISTSGFMPVGGKLFFSAQTGETGWELWMTDGTAGGTVLIKDINPTLRPNQFGYIYGNSSSPSEFASFDGRLYFSADDGSSGRELWVSDGTLAGTNRVLDINPGPGGSDPANLQVVGNNLYFTADNGTHGREAWIISNNAQPVDITSSTDSLSENIAANSLVNTFATVDVDVVESFVYELVSGDGALDNSAFVIAGNQLKIINSPDFETKSSYSIRVRTTDSGGLSFEKALTFAVNNLNEAPTDITPSSTNFNENIVAGSAVASLTTTDPDAGDTFAYSFATGAGSTDNTSFAINGNQIQIVASPDFETKSSYSVRVRSTDSGGVSFEKALTFAVNDLADTGGGGGGGGGATPTTPTTPTTPVTPTQPTTPQQPSQPSTSTDIRGDDQANRLEPKQTGQNRMTGEGDSDIFVQSVSEPFTRGNADIVTDFNSREDDSFELHRDVFGGLTGIKLKTVRSKREFKKEQSKSSNLIYDIKKGELWYDANGREKGFGQDGGIFMILENKAPLAAGDFSII